MSETCINCGAWKGLHHFDTSACPAGGVEQQGKGNYGPGVYREQPAAIETNGPANIIALLIGEHQPPNLLPGEQDVIGEAIEMAKDTQKYMKQYSDAVRRGATPLAWHEVIVQAKTERRNRAAD